MKVLHLVDSLGPGGMENGIVNLAHGLAPDIESHVACLVRTGRFAERLPESAQVIVLGKLDGFSPLAAWRLFTCIRRARPNVLHTHNLGPLIYGSLATGGGRLCAMVHGEHSLLTTEEKTARRLRQRRRLYRGCRAIHSVSRGIRDEVVALGCEPKNMLFIPNGVDTEAFSPGEPATARRTLSLPENGLMIGIVGRFGAEKGHAVLIDAFEALASRTPVPHLVIIGSGGPAEAAIRRRCAQSPARSRIHLTGFLQHPLEGYRALDLLVIPSTNEGMANAALEAMSCGVSVLANTGCGHEEFIEDGVTGAIRNLRTPAALCSSMEDLIGAPGRLQELGAQARRVAVKRFSLAQMLDAYSALYASTCRSKLH